LVGGLRVINATLTAQLRDANPQFSVVCHLSHATVSRHNG
jgi:hypothetical protein